MLFLTLENGDPSIRFCKSRALRKQLARLTFRLRANYCLNLICRPGFKSCFRGICAKRKQRVCLKTIRYYCNVPILSTHYKDEWLDWIFLWLSQCCDARSEDARESYRCLSVRPEWAKQNSSFDDIWQWHVSKRWCNASETTNLQMGAAYDAMRA